MNHQRAARIRSVYQDRPLDFLNMLEHQLDSANSLKPESLVLGSDIKPGVLREQQSFSSLASSVKSYSSEEQPTSSYWKVNDKEQFLTSMDVRDDRLCALGSGAAEENLFIYEAYTDEVIHHQTITLPEIVALRWAPLSSALGQLGNVLLSGHRDGAVHMTLLPDSTAKSGSAEILKRYNHMKHVSIDPHRHYSTRIKSMELTSPTWASCPAQSLFSLCADHIFLWEANRSDVPLIMQRTSNVNTLDLSADRDGVFAVGRRRGVCIRDIRVKDGLNAGLKPPIGNTHNVSVVKWNTFDSSNQFVAVHDETTIKLWDIRNNQPLATFSGHVDDVTALEWSSPTEFVSSSADGTVRVWNTQRDGRSQADVEMGQMNANEDSRWNDYQQRMSSGTALDAFANDILTDKPKVNLSRHFVSMKLANMGPEVEAITIDSGGYIGIHELY